MRSAELCQWFGTFALGDNLNSISTLFIVGLPHNTAILHPSVINGGQGSHFISMSLAVFTTDNSVCYPPCFVQILYIQKRRLK